MAEKTFICEGHLRGACQSGSLCQGYHHELPYLWQVEKDGQCVNLIEQGEEIEESFCDPSKDSCTVLFPATLDSGQSSTASIAINFETFKARIQLLDQTVHASPNSALLAHPVRRLATHSYIEWLQREETKDDKQGSCGFCTQWRWYYNDGPVWVACGQNMEKPHQVVLESKFAAGQQIYRFESEDGRRAGSTKTYLLDLYLMQAACLESGTVTKLRRRPYFCKAERVRLGQYLNSPPVMKGPIGNEIPEGWYPVDTSSNYELVPVKPGSTEFSFVVRSFCDSWEHWSKHNERFQGSIKDIMKLQNVFLWQKYKCKKELMAQKGHPWNEKFLFHGTPDEGSILGIFNQNFDPRISGRNATMFGKGTYFAVDAYYSHRYTMKVQSNKVRWMFFARVLTGLSTEGKKDMVRPPPLDLLKPYGDLYDSCTSTLSNSRVFVIFDADQCYPEYAISYCH